MSRATPPSQRYDLDRLVRLAFGAAGAFLLVWLLRYLADVLIPFAVAILLAYLINPVVNALESCLKSRAAATLLTVFGCLVVLSALVVIAIPVAASQIADFTTVIDSLREDAVAFRDARPLRERIDDFIAAQDNQTVRDGLEIVRQRLRDALTRERVEQYAMNLGRRLAPGVLSVVSGAFSFVVGLSVLIIILLYVVFVSVDYGRIAGGWKSYLPPQHRDRIVAFLNEFSYAMSRYFRGQIVIALICGVLFAVAFRLIGLRMGILLGLFIGLLNVVPYLQIVGMVPALMLAVLRAVERGGSVFWSVALVLAIFGIVQIVQDGILVPRIMGKQTGLRPAVMLLGIFVWGKLLGFLGLVLAIPLTCLGIAFYRRTVLGHADASAIPADDSGDG
ncbi:MAG: AI-2E family transporter [Phycisphaerae bacterium]|nr:AI-2E family transporter [Phycisphaerae bacterium]